MARTVRPVRPVTEPDSVAPLGHRVPHPRGPGSRRHPSRTLGTPLERPIAITPELDRRLTLLTQALEVPGADLASILAVLHDDLVTAVPSFLGLAVTRDTRPGGGDRTPVLTTLTDPGAVRASMRLTLRSGSRDGSGLVFEFFAGDPDAFTALVGDARTALGEPGDVRVDPHPDIPPAGHPWSGDASDPEVAGEPDQAVGVLLARGHSDPHAALDEYAARHGLSRPAAARRILDSLDLHPE